VGRDELKAGDVLIFSNEIDGDAAFVAICAGNDQFISCNRPDSPTDLHKFSNYYEQRFICGRRIG
ncbi:MAG: peptidase, partial [Clostridia bacterium]|nr:peptidase [Clostridia bacterium]